MPFLSGDEIMGNTKTREPKQKRSIEKRDKIIEAGFQLLSEKGYHNTNTAEIAKLAGVSTGIVYSYFQDKKDIFIMAVDKYMKDTIHPIYEYVSNLQPPIDIEKAIRQIVTSITNSHTMVKSIHEELQALSHIDDDIREAFCRITAEIATDIIQMLEKFEIRPTNAFEKVHLSIGIIEDLVHNKIYHNHDYLNYDAMTDIAVKTITDMLTS